MFQRILVPVDGGRAAEKAVPYAIGLASALDAEVMICHVVTAPAAAKASGQGRQAAQYLARLAQRFQVAGVAAKTRLCWGDPAMEIKKTAVDWGANAIVMATRSRRRLEKLVLGSVADAVVRDSRLPVMLVSSGRQAPKASRRAA